MSVQEFVERFYQLDKDAQKQVRELIQLDTNEPADAAFDYDTWFREVEALRQEITASHGGEMPAVDVVGILRDIRDGEDE